MRETILVVEDEALLYDRMATALEEQQFKVLPYAPSVTAACEFLDNNQIDLVLLDIDLQGDLTGLYLANLLTETYKIPFIYVTQHDDDRTFYKGLDTGHKHYVVKSKPSLNLKEVLRAVETVLASAPKKNAHKSESLAENETVTTTGIMGLTNYLDVLRESGLDTISRVPVPYNDILYFTVKPFQNKDNPHKQENTRTNYLWFKTKSGAMYFLKSSLRQLKQTLPHNFMRINESYIVNLNPDILDGRINGSRLSIFGEILTIKDTYKDDVRKRLDDMYQG